MEFFEKLGKKASETYKTAAEKTNKIANETKLKMKINDCKSKIKDIYTEIGRTVYRKYALDGELVIKEDLQKDLDRISELTDEIEGYEVQLLELSDKKQCVNCKNKIEKSAKFCPECGAEQPDGNTQEQPETNTKNQENSENQSSEQNEDTESVAEETEEIVAEVVINEDENTDSQN